VLTVRRILIAALSVAVAVAVAVAVIVTVRQSPRAVAAPLIPARGTATASPAALALTAPLDRFGLALLAQEAQADQGNIVISPLSVHDVLSMILNGAQGQTAAEMRSALALGALPLNQVNQGWADLLAAAQAGSKPAVQIANSLWLKDGVPFNPAFLAANQNFFAATMRALASDPNRAAGDINGWVDQRTAGLIKKIVDASMFDSQTIMALVNTVHVKAAWVTPFTGDSTHAAPFTLGDGTQVQAQMMNGPVQGPVARTAAYDAIALQTKQGITAWIVVPKGSQTPEALIGSLSKKGLTSLYDAAKPAAAMLSLPRFKTEFSAPDLKGALSALGMPRAFSPDQAELFGIVKPGTPGVVYIQRVVHKTVLDVNENGFEAAAATAGLVGLSAAPYAPITIRADRPFLMILTVKTTQAPLFMAIIRDPRS
jgi:serpin B